jgi:Fe-S cluster biogenesis protein NfuA
MTTEELMIEVEKHWKKSGLLNSDGGDISLVSIEEGKHVKVRLEGACTSCSVNQMTLRAGVDYYQKFAPQIETGKYLLKVFMICFPRKSLSAIADKPFLKGRLSASAAAYRSLLPNAKPYTRLTNQFQFKKWMY